VVSKLLGGNTKMSLIEASKKEEIMKGEQLVEDTNIDKEVKQEGFLKAVNSNIVDQYMSLENEIADMQLRIYQADKITKRKQRRAKLQNKLFLLSNSESVRIRNEIVSNMEKKCWIQRVIDFIKDIFPIVKIIGSLVGALLTAILSIDFVKSKISPNMLNGMNQLMRLCVSPTHEFVAKATK